MESGLFSPFFYLTVNPDVLHARVDPLKHFCTKGWREGRSPSVDFDVKAYLQKNPDVERARINPLVHYLQSGKKEGRAISPVLYFGESFNDHKAIKQDNWVGTESKADSIVGPIIDRGWGESIKVIASLKSLGKIVNKNIPRNIARKQLESYPLSISVVMPTWNRANSICKSIDSILQQSYLPKEIIISDDEPDKLAVLDFEVDSYQVEDAEQLAILMEEHQRNLCHAHFAYPSVTKAEDCGVPGDKIAFNIQAVNVEDFSKELKPSINATQEKAVYRGIVVTRFVEKKGLSTLIEAASLLKDQPVEFDIYGYGPLEEDYKKQIEELGLENVFLKGPLANQKSVAEAYQQSSGYQPAEDVTQLASNVRKLISMSPHRKVAMIKRSQDFLNKKIGVQQTMQMLLDTWQGYTLDIFLVTYNTEKYEDRNETFQIIERIYKYTTTPFTLTVIDNDSD
ncbi:hypothetical protein GQR58_021234 [Nymphon striatum]|nr:hypothetical protein GQR58_021234 [Nymphon striatum]